MFKKIISKLRFGSSKTKTTQDIDACKESETKHESKDECCSTETKHESKDECCSTETKHEGKGE
jgi:hypothetical protein|tara:strand:+ start:224 stop:415 length:192 start_codon:yes stop_codon:yes gene_type:complete